MDQWTGCGSECQASFDCDISVLNVASITRAHQPTRTLRKPAEIKSRSGSIASLLFKSGFKPRASILRVGEQKRSPNREIFFYQCFFYKTSIQQHQPCWVYQQPYIRLHPVSSSWLQRLSG